MNDKKKELENELVSYFGDDELKTIVQQMAEIVRVHHLQKQPVICRKLFSYLSDVIDGWNCV